MNDIRGISVAATQLRDSLRMLAGAGVRSDVPDNEIGYAIATVGLLNSKLSVRFTDTVVSIDGKRRDTADAHEFQSRCLDAAALRKLVAVVADHADLTAEESSGWTSLQALIARGATFQMTTHKTSYRYGDEKSQAITVSIPTDKKGGQALIFLQSTVPHSDYKLTCTIDKHAFPVDSMASLHGLMAPVASPAAPLGGKPAAMESETSMDALRETLKTLNAHGIEVSVGDAPDALTVAIRRLETGQSLDAHFKDEGIVTTWKDKQIKTSADALRHFQIVTLGADRLRKAAAVVSDQHHLLTCEELSALKAINSLMTRRAKFVLRHSRSQWDFVHDRKTVVDTLSIPSDKGGCARILLHLAENGLVNQLAVAVDGETFPINSHDQLVAISRNTAAAAALRDILKTLREHGIETEVQDNPIAISAKAQQLTAPESKYGSSAKTVEIRIPQAPVGCTLKGKETPLAESHLRSMRTFSLNWAQLNAFTAVLANHAADLTDDQNAMLHAVDKLTRYGARFQLTRIREQKRELFPNKIFNDVMPVPSDNVGRAMILAHLAIRQGKVYYSEDDRRLSYIFDGRAEEVHRTSELTAVAQHLL